MPGKTLTAHTDQYILEKLRNPEQTDSGFRLLIEKYQQRIYMHIRRMVIDHADTDDVLQEVFVKIWKNIHSFRGDSELYTWIFRIASNEALGFLKKKKRRQAVSLDKILESEQMTSQNTAFSDESENMIRFQKALVQLPDKQRLVFNMKYFEEMKYAEMAEITGNSIGALKASYHHAVKKLEKMLSSF